MEGSRREEMEMGGDSRHSRAYIITTIYRGTAYTDHVRPVWLPLHGLHYIHAITSAARPLKAKK